MSKIMSRLAELRDQQRISELSYQFGEFLMRVDPECAESVILAGCLTAQRKEEGNVCVELPTQASTTLFADSADLSIKTDPLEQWKQELSSSKLVGKPGQAAPLILDEQDRLYLHKLWSYEKQLADKLLDKARLNSDLASHPRLRSELDQLFGRDDSEIDWQKVSAWSAVRNNLTIISGGPGTGKTTTVVRILMLLARLNALDYVALAAPTGKAASRLIESVTQALEQMKPEPSVLEKLPQEAFTIHKLLGARRHGSGFRYNRENPLPYNLVVVDEASMVDLALMVKLVDALPRHSKLILLGDKDQLASVEAGAVLGSICAEEQNQFSSATANAARELGMKIPETALKANPKPLTDHIVLLEKSYRFGAESGIGQLSQAILNAKAEEATQILQSEKYADTRLQSFEKLSEFKSIILDFLADHHQQVAGAQSVDEALDKIGQRGILCVHRRGPLGANQVNMMAERLLRQSGYIPASEEWYAGKPVMVTRNDYSLGLRNGEIGLTLRNEEGELKVYFPESEGSFRSFYPSRLSQIETAYAITVHKSQGSEFNKVAVVLPAQVSAISTRELLYTAVTRARHACSIIGSSNVLAGTIRQHISRSSGLKDRLWTNRDNGE